MLVAALSKADLVATEADMLTLQVLIPLIGSITIMLCAQTMTFRLSNPYELHTYTLSITTHLLQLA